MHTTTNPGYQVLGIVDDVTECGCCGRADLKATVALLFDGDADVTYFGRTCAARHAGTTAAAITREARAADRERKAAQERERQARRNAEHDAYSAWLRERTGGFDLSYDLRVNGFDPLALCREYRQSRR